ncbi:hypothetical protein ACZ87_03942, partial [Candidatus Erwinia dacicola]
MYSSICAIFLIYQIKPNVCCPPSITSGRKTISTPQMTLTI